MRLSNIQHLSLLTGLLLSAFAFGPMGGALAQVAVNRPLLEELNRQVESLYHQVAPGVVRVQLPTTRPSTQPLDAAAIDPMSRWDQKLSPELRERLRENPPLSPASVTEITPVPGPMVVGPSSRDAAGSPPTARRLFLFTPNVLGVVIDAQGHALLPMFVPAENIGDKPLTVLMCDGKITAARFVGSDRQTNLTVVQLLHGIGQPLAFSSEPPVEGALVMAMSMDPAATRLAVWTRWSNSWGLIVKTDGTVAGFSQRGGFLSGVACAAVVRQLIEQGHVTRPKLGVVVHFVDPNDPLRADPALGQAPALQIDTVLANSAAHRGGLLTGDLILKLAGEPVSGTLSFGAAITAKHGPTQLQILRQDQIISVTVDLEPDASN